MKTPFAPRMNRPLLATLLAGVLGITAARAQTSEAESTAPQLPPNRVALVRLGADATVASNESVRTLFVLGGRAQIDGTVRRDTVIVFGDTRVTGHLGGDLILVGGTARLEPGARLSHNLINVGATLSVDPAVALPPERVDMTVGQTRGLQALGAVVEWVRHGLVQGRPFVPRLGWNWVWAILFLLLHLALAGLFPKTTQHCVNVVLERPVGIFVIGLVTLLLGALGAAILAVTVVGGLFLPFVACVVGLALLFGKIAVYRVVGARFGGWLAARPALALTLGSFACWLVYMIPMAGMIALGIVTLAALGAGTLAGASSLRREAALAAAKLASAPGVVMREPPSAGAVAPPVIHELALLPRAGFWSRLLATLLDFIAFLPVLVIFHPPPRGFLLLWLAYHVGLWIWRGSTLGGLLMGLQVVREDGARVTWLVALVRGLAACLSGLVLCLGYFWIGWSREKRGWHDLIAGTIVVRLPRRTPLV